MASSEFDPYEVLGVRHGATEEEIRAAYKEQALRFHPDKHRGNPLEPLAVERLRDINRAREMLLDSARGHARGGGRSWGGDSGRRDVAGRGRPADLVSWLGGTLGTIVAVVFLLRFGTVLIREIFALVRGAVMGLLWLARMSPMFVIAFMVVGAMLAGYWLKARHRER
jgi:hypothetical protein